MTEQDEPWRPLAEAVQDFANSVAHEEGASPRLVMQALVVWEEASVTEEGETQRRVTYTVPSDNWSIAGAIGLAEAGRTLVGRDALAEDDEEDL